MMMIMHEPDTHKIKNHPENGFWSLLCIFQSQQTGGGLENARRGSEQGGFAAGAEGAASLCSQGLPSMLQEQG